MQDLSQAIVELSCVADDSYISVSFEHTTTDIGVHELEFRSCAENTGSYCYDVISINQSAYSQVNTYI